MPKCPKHSFRWNPQCLASTQKTSRHGAMQEIIAHLEDISEFMRTDTEQTQGSDKRHQSRFSNWTLCVPKEQVEAWRANAHQTSKHEHCNYETKITDVSGKEITEFKALSTEKHEQRRKTKNRSGELGHSIKPPHVPFKCRGNTWRTNGQIFFQSSWKKNIIHMCKNVRTHPLFCTNSIY